MPRVCFLLNNEFVLDNRVRREALSLVSAGYEVTLLCVADTEKRLPRQETPDGFHIHRLLPKRLPSFKVLDKQHIRAFLRIIRAYPRFDVVHAHDMNTLLLGWALARYWGAKLVYDSHEFWESIYQEEKQKLLKQSKVSKIAALRNRKKIKPLEQLIALEKWLLPRCDAVITVNESLGQMLQDKIAQPIANLAIIRNIPGFAQLPSPEKPRYYHAHFGLPPETRVLLYQGGITEQRGILQLLDMMEILNRDDVALVLMGPVDRKFYAPLFERVFASPRLKRSVFYKHAVTGPDFPCWTASADLGLAPILNCRSSYYYCLPNKLFEYLQGALPVGVSDFPEMKKLVTSYEVGFTFDPDDPKDIAAKVEAFFEDSGRQEAYRQNLAKAKEELHWENEQHRLLDLYQALLKGTPQQVAAHARLETARSTNPA